MPPAPQQTTALLDVCRVNTTCQTPSLALCTSAARLRRSDARASRWVTRTRTQTRRGTVRWDRSELTERPGTRSEDGQRRGGRLRRRAGWASRGWDGLAGEFPWARREEGVGRAPKGRRDGSCLKLPGSRQDPRSKAICTRLLPDFARFDASPPPSSPAQSLSIFCRRFFSVSLELSPSSGSPAAHPIKSPARPPLVFSPHLVSHPAFALPRPAVVLLVARPLSDAFSACSAPVPHLRTRRPLLDP